MIALCNVTSCISDIDAVKPGKPILYIVSNPNCTQNK